MGEWYEAHEVECIIDLELDAAFRVHLDAMDRGELETVDGPTVVAEAYARSEAKWRRTGFKTRGEQ